MRIPHWIGPLELLALVIGVLFIAWLAAVWEKNK
jgi:hypothetical protein